MTAPAAAKTVLITGAGRGIGRAIALDLARQTPANLILVSRTETCLETAKQCEAIRAGSARAFVWDVSEIGPKRDAVLAAVSAAEGPIGAVLAAGVLGPTGPFVGNDLAAWWRAVEVNVRGTVATIHGLLPRMLKDGAGRMVLFAGGGSAYGYPSFSSYGMAKAALVRFTETLAMEIGDRGPLVTIVAPGANDTDMLAEVKAAGGSIKTTVSIEEPCRAARRLLTEDTRGLHGRFIHVRDEWTPESAQKLPEGMWKLRRVEP
jgi:NAD(P)-dependent dehydrogenase (short-subunit alcohol dehydrogenase family)